MTKIYYFSGTGNTLWSAEKIAQSIGGDCRLINIGIESQKEKIVLEADSIVLLYPAYAYGVPVIVRRFLKRAVIKASHISVFTTYGSTPGGALAEVARMFSRKKLKNAYYGKIASVQNYYVIFGTQKPQKIQKRIALQSADTDAAAHAVTHKLTNRVNTFRPLSQLIAMFFSLGTRAFYKWYKVNGSCDGCGICEKLCPVSAISMVNNKPAFSNKCQHCQGCINWCPKKAIRYISINPNTSRYIHPEIPLDRMLRCAEGARGSIGLVIGGRTTKQFALMTEGKTTKQFALVTGASSGIGLAVSRELARNGFHILLVSNEKEKLEQTAAEISDEFKVAALPYCTDLARQDCAQELFDYCAANHISVSVLVNNAGIFFFRDVADTPVERVDAMLNLHVYTPTMLCRLFCKQMIRESRRGFVMNMASISAWMRVPGMTLYYSTKNYTRTFSRSLRNETIDRGISITTVCPGPVATSLYNLSPRHIKLGIRTGVIMPPEKFAKRALKRMFKGKRQYTSGGIVSRLAIFVVNALPESLIRRIKKRVIKT